jgi:AcrR family transcriptional regulator
MSTRSQAPAAASTGRERISEAAYELFSREGTQTVGIDSIIARAGAAKMTLYRNFPSKDALILDFLSRREQRWTRDWLQTEVEHRADTPQGVLLAIFDVFGEWFAGPDFDGCAFITAIIGYQETPGAVRDASVTYLANIRAFLAGHAAATGIADPDAFARQWHILMKGSIVAAHEGDVEAAGRAKELGVLLLRSHGITVDTVDLG